MSGGGVPTPMVLSFMLAMSPMHPWIGRDSQRLLQSESAPAGISDQDARDKARKALEEAMPSTKVFAWTLVKPVLDQIKIPESQEMAIGARFHHQIAERLKAGRLDRYPEEVKYLNWLGERIAFRVKRQNIHYSFHIYESSAPNAFSHAGGYVYVSRGLLDLLENEAQLAFVLGHEISHVDLEHCTEIIKPLVLAEKVKTWVPGAVLDTGVFFARISVLAESTLYSEAKELEADRRGCDLTFQEGFDPMETVRFLRTAIAQRQAKNRPADPGLADAFLRSHPDAAYRAEALERYADRLKWNFPNQRTWRGADRSAWRSEVP